MCRQNNDLYKPNLTKTIDTCTYAKVGILRYKVDFQSFQMDDPEPLEGVDLDEY